MKDPSRNENRNGHNGTGKGVSKVPEPDGEGIFGCKLRVAGFDGGIAEVLRAGLHENPSIIIGGLEGKGKSTR